MSEKTTTREIKMSLGLEQKKASQFHVWLAKIERRQSPPGRGEWLRYNRDK